VRRLTAEFAKLRDVDPCALLDREAIKVITRVKVGDHVPGRHLSECGVDTEIDEFTPGWSFSVDVGVLYQPSEHNRRRETIDNREFFVDDDDRRCEYTLMVSDDIGVSLATSAPPFDKTGTIDESPCDMAQSYLTKAIESYTAMRLREQRLTLPQLPLASHDPCEAVPEVAQALGTEAIGVPVRTYLCSIEPVSSVEDSPLTGQGLTVVYEYIADPRSDVPDDAEEVSPPGDSDLGTPTAITIAGHSGSQFDGGRELGCSINLLFGEQEAKQKNALAKVQVVSVLARDCGVSKSVAEAVITKISGV